MTKHEGSAYQANRSGSAKAESASTDPRVDILEPIEADGRALLSCLQENGIRFWAYCTVSRHTYLLGSDGFVIGIAPGLFQPPGGTVAEDDRAAVAEAFADMQTLDASREVRFRVKDSTGNLRWLRCTGRRLPGKSPARLGGLLVDITAEIEALEMQALIMREVQHRLNNLFAVISGMVRGLSRHLPDTPTLVEELGGRLDSLARAHNLPWNGEIYPTLGDLLSAILEPYRGLASLQLDGPAISVRSDAVMPLALILHEWATNSVKYGCLGGGEKAQLTVCWETDGSQLKMLWIEDIPGSDRDPEGKSGFGSLLLDALVKQLGAHFERRIFSNHAVLSITLPVQHLAEV